MKVLGRMAMAAVAGGGLVLAFPNWNRAWVVWVWLMPLLWVLWSVRGKRAGWRGFGYGWLAGMVFFGLNLGWLGTVTTVGGTLLAAYLAVYFGLWGAYAATWGNPWRASAAESVEGARGRTGSVVAAGESWRSLRLAFGNAALWCGLEWARGWVLTGFGWNGLGVAFHQSRVLSQAADLLGICGLAFLPVFMQVIWLQAVRRLVVQARGGDRRPYWDLAAATLLLMAVLGYGMWRLAATGHGESVRLKALLVQLDVPQDVSQVLWPAEQVHMAYEDETLGALEMLEKRNAGHPSREGGTAGGGAPTRIWPQWIVWPETALTGRVMRTNDGGWGMWRENWETIHRVRAAGDFTFLMGLNELEGEGNGQELTIKENGRAWNSLVVLPPDDRLTSFQKRHLVIFGEYIPLVDQLPFLKTIYEQQAGTEYHGAFDRGESLEPLRVKVGEVETGVVPSVCFEDTVPRLQRKFVRDGPQVLVNVTNDGWFGTSAAAAQHFANARFRAIELRRPMIRCANTGVTAVVAANGSTAHPDTGKPQELIDANGSHFTRGWMLGEADIPLHPPWTMYAWAGDWPVIGLGILGLWSGWRRRNGRDAVALRAMPKCASRS